MNWNREFKWSNRSQFRTAALLWASLALILILPVAIGHLNRLHAWKRAVLLGGWGTRSMHEQIKTNLIRSASNADVPLLIELIDKGPTNERFRWIAVLQRFEGPEVIATFLKLASDKDEETRSTALFYLSSKGDARAAPVLLEALTTAEYTIPAALGLGRLGEHRAIAPIMKILMRAEAPDVLTDTEVILGRTASALAGQSFDFKETCKAPHTCIDPELSLIRSKYLQGRNPDMIAEINSVMVSRKRKYCDNHGPVSARQQLLAWWRTHQQQKGG